MGRYSLIIVATLFLLLTYFVISMSNTGTATIRRNIDSYEYNNAKNIAHSAAQFVIKNVIDRNSGWIFDDSVTNPIPNFTPLLEGNYKISSIEKTSGVSPNEYFLHLIITGKSQNKTYDTTVRLHRALDAPNIFEYAAYTQSLLDIGPQGTIDSFNSDISNEILNGNALIAYGPDGSIDYHNNSEINGTIHHKVEKDMTPLTYDASNAEIISISGGETFDGEGETVEYLIDGDINISGSGSEIEFVNGDFILYVPGDIKIGGQGYITIGDDASVTIYLDGNLDLAGSGFVNTTNVAANLVIFGTDNSEMTIDLQGSTNAEFVGAIYAPTSHVLIRGGSDFTVRGSIISNSMVIRANLYYDESLADFIYAEYGTSSTRLYVVSWE